MTTFELSHCSLTSIPPARRDSLAAIPQAIPQLLILVSTARIRNITRLPPNRLVQRSIKRHPTSVDYPRIARTPLEAKLMADQTSTKSAISRRSARVYSEEQDGTVELGTVGQSQGQGSCSSESRYGSGDERADREKTPRKRSRSLSYSGNGYEDGMIERVDLGRDVKGLFATTFEEIGKQGTLYLFILKGSTDGYTVAKSLQAAKNKTEGRPLNFGTIIPSAIYRSSFPAVEDHPFLGSLGLKSVV